MNSSQNSSSLWPLCQEIENQLLKSKFALLIYTQLPLMFAILVSTVLLVVQYFKCRIVLHGNLLIIFVNIVIIYFIAILGQFAWLLRYRILLFYYTDPCQLLTPLWMVCFFFGPTNFQNLAYPGLHFCAMIERARATWHADRYEHTGSQFGIGMVIVVWLFSLAYALFIVVGAYLSPEMLIQGPTYMTSKYSAQLSIYVFIFTMALVVVTAYCDWRITVRNGRIREMSQNRIINYSLSRNYQLNENMLTMRLILPLDIAYALLYSIYTVLVLVVRYLKPMLETSDYTFYYNAIQSILYVYSLITMVVYIRFLKYMRNTQKRAVEQKPKAEHAKIYFRQLEAQWG